MFELPYELWSCILADEKFHIGRLLPNLSGKADCSASF